MVQRPNGAGLRPRRGALAPLLLVVDAHHDPAIDGDRIEDERETLFVLGCPRNSDVGPACIVAVAGYIEQAVARAVFGCIGHCLSPLAFTEGPFPRRHGETRDLTMEARIKGRAKHAYGTDLHKRSAEGSFLDPRRGWSKTHE